MNTRRKTSGSRDVDDEDEVNTMDRVLVEVKERRNLLRNIMKSEIKLIGRTM